MIIHQIVDGTPRLETVIVYAAQAIGYVPESDGSMITDFSFMKLIRNRSLTNDNIKAVQPLVLNSNGLSALTRLLDNNDHQIAQLAVLSALPTLFQYVFLATRSFSPNPRMRND